MEIRIDADKLAEKLATDLFTERLSYGYYKYKEVWDGESLSSKGEEIFDLIKENFTSLIKLFELK